MNAEFLPQDLYRFLGHDLAIRSNSKEMLEGLRLMYGRFYLGPDEGPSGRRGPSRRRPIQTMEILDNLASSNQLLLRDDHYLYRFTRIGKEGHFSCQDRQTLDLDLIGFCDPLTLVQSALLTTVSALADNYHLFHAGVVSQGKEAIILPGSSGMGKTTLVLKLVTEGFKFLSDEVACLDPERAIVAPFPRSLNLHPDSQELLNIPVPENAPRHPVGDREWEWSLDIEDLVPGCVSGPCKPRYMIFLRGFADRARLEYLSRSNALFELFRSFVHSKSDLSQALFKFAPLLDSLECYNLVIGDLDETAKLLVDLTHGADREYDPIGT